MYLIGCSNLYLPIYYFRSQNYLQLWIFKIAAPNPPVVCPPVAAKKELSTLWWQVNQKHTDDNAFWLGYLLKLCIATSRYIFLFQIWLCVE